MYSTIYIFRLVCWTFRYGAVIMCETGERSRYSDSLRAGRSGVRIPVEARFSAPVHTGPGAHPASYTGYRVFPGGKTAGAWRWPSTPSSAEVKENVELYLYSLSGPSWPILGWTLRLPLLWYVACSMCVVYSVFLFSCGAGWVLKGKESIKILILIEYGAKGWTGLNVLTI